MELERTTEAEGLKKFPKPPSFLSGPNGIFSESTCRTIDIFADTHFIGCTDVVRCDVTLNALSTITIWLGKS